MAQRNKKSDQIEYRLLGISTEQFATLFEPESSEYEIGSKVEVGSNYDSRTVAVKISIQFLFEARVFMQIAVACGFEISEKSWTELSDNGNRNVVLQREIATSLIYIVFNTMRGVLHAKTENTPFNYFHIPLISEDIIEGGDYLIEK